MPLAMPMPIPLRHGFQLLVAGLYTNGYMPLAMLCLHGYVNGRISASGSRAMPMATPMATPIPMAIPSSYFLELTVGGLRAGIIYIYIYTHKRVSATRKSWASLPVFNFMPYADGQEVGRTRPRP